MKNSKLQKRVLSFICVLSVTILFAVSFFAGDIPQKIGFKDVAFSNLNRVSCVDCHGDTLADTHHSTKPATSGDCSSCHSVSTSPGKVGVALERNCMVCHSKSPHHRTEAAENNECTTCHDSPGLGDFSNVVPSYKVSKVTPTVENCKTCHKEGTVDGQKVYGMKKTHHGIALKGCNNCHGEGDKKNTSIRTCQRCHNVKAIHEVLPHVEKENCVKCHGGVKAAAKPVQ
jgi:hypothetical protein